MKYVIDIFSKYAFIYLYILHILDESSPKPNKIWVDNGSQFYNRSMRSWLRDNDIEMHSAHNEHKSVVSEDFRKQNLQMYDFSIKNCVYW